MMFSGFLLILFLFFLNVYGFNDNRVINGVQAPSDKYLNVVKIYSIQPKTEKSESKLVICTGTIISKRYILTAAHCVTYTDPETGKILTVPIFKIDIRPEDPVKNVWKPDAVAVVAIYHQEYDSGFFGDIAILKVLEDITDIEPVLLAKDYVARKNDTGINVGYGDMDPDVTKSDDPDTLMEINIPILSKQECKYSGKYKLDVICAGTKTTRSDHGDSGGPLFFTSDNGKQYEVGIAHALVNADGTRHDDKIQPDFATYTSVSAFCPWIEEVTNNEVHCVEMRRRNEPLAQNGAMSKNIFIILFVYVFNIVLAF
uniref:Peptidase S1 domain-containing protein n=1 Tax=Panagrolaimus sp. PS1159 TaxID=55785 RepID=A0AC35GMN7_9BILA